MSSSTSGRDDDAPDLVCQLDCVHGMVDALSSARWKRHQDTVMELSAHGIVITVEESSCLQAKVFLKSELFVEYEFAGARQIQAPASLTPVAGSPVATPVCLLSAAARQIQAPASPTPVLGSPPRSPARRPLPPLLHHSPQPAGRRMNLILQSLTEG